ncbi:MAG: hypothetical protein K2G49_00330 [Muribaculum sp.]|nr:hypothetical protein [Muribaculum sp.]
MKKIFNSIASLALLLGTGLFTACSPEEFDTVNPDAIPEASDINVTVTVDQETNEYTLTLNNPGYYPVWTIHTSPTKEEISTRPVYKGIITVAGTYPVEVRMGNRNGVSTGSKVVEINIENTLVDYTPYMRRLTNGDSKTWMFAADKGGHLGCGESGSDGLGWWSAAPHDKDGVGMYENRFIFADNGGTDSGKYTYDPGTSGTIYVNTGITSLPPYSDSNPGDGVDYSAPAQLAESSFRLTTEGTDMYLVFPEGTLLGYLPFNEAYDNPKFKVHSITNDNIELSIDNGSIAWHYILGLEGEAPFTGFKYDSEFNMWRNANVTVGGFYYAPGWAQIADPAYEVTTNGYTLTLPAATSDQWQAQMPLITDISANSATNYDFSVVLNSSTDHPGVTVKLTQDGDDGNFLFEERVALKAYEDFVFYKSDLPGIDAPTLKLVLDFGGNAENTEISISNIVLKNHADDDGTVLPAEKPEEPEAPVTWVDEANLWTAATYTTEFFYAPGWAQIADPGFEENGKDFTVTLPEATSDQWQAQVKLHSDISTAADKQYDFRIVMNSTTDHPGVTVKLVLAGGGDNDNVFYMADRVKLTAYDDCEFKWVNMPGIDMDKVSLVLDFGGCAPSTVVNVSKIHLQEHHE